MTPKQLPGVRIWNNSWKGDSLAFLFEQSSPVRRQCMPSCSSSQRGKPYPLRRSVLPQGGCQCWLAPDTHTEPGNMPRPWGSLIGPSSECLQNQWGQPKSYSTNNYWLKIEKLKECIFKIQLDTFHLVFCSYNLIVQFYRLIKNSEGKY